MLPRGCLAAGKLRPDLGRWEQLAFSRLPAPHPARSSPRAWGGAFPTLQLTAPRAAHGLGDKVPVPAPTVQTLQMSPGAHPELQPHYSPRSPPRVPWIPALLQASAHSPSSTKLRVGALGATWTVCICHMVSLPLSSASSWTSGNVWEVLAPKIPVRSGSTRSTPLLGRSGLTGHRPVGMWAPWGLDRKELGPQAGSRPVSHGCDAGSMDRAGPSVTATELQAEKGFREVPRRREQSGGRRACPE